MEVVRPQLLPRVDFVHAPADEVGAEPRGDLGLANPKPLVFHFVAALNGEEVHDLHRGNSKQGVHTRRGLIADWERSHE
jgi:hypothetical protein